MRPTTWGMPAAQPLHKIVPTFAPTALPTIPTPAPVPIKSHTALEMKIRAARQAARHAASVQLAREQALREQQAAQIQAREHTRHRAALVVLLACATSIVLLCFALLQMSLVAQKDVRPAAERGEDEEPVLASYGADDVESSPAGADEPGRPSAAGKKRSGGKERPPAAFV